MLGAGTTASPQLRLVYKLRGFCEPLSPCSDWEPWRLGLGMAKGSASLNSHCPSSGGGRFHCCGLAVLARAKASPFPELESQPADLSAQQCHADLSGHPRAARLALPSILMPHSAFTILLICLYFWRSCFYSRSVCSVHQGKQSVL